MLILSRKIGERIVVSEDIFFTVMDIKGNQVRLGVDAPMDIPVHREEIYLKVKAVQDELNAEATKTPLNLVDTYRAYKKLIVRQLPH